MTSEQSALWQGLPEPAEMEQECDCGGEAFAREGERASQPRLKRVDRNQMQMRVVDVERLIAEDHPARAIWEFVGRLDLSGYCGAIRAVAGKAGRSAYDPRLLISLWVYGYSQGVGSARAIARLCEMDPAFEWLTGMEEISAHTLSDFRVAHGEALQAMFTEVLGLLSAEGLVTLERVMQDGTKIRASASSDSYRTEARVAEHLKLARQHVQAVAAEEEEETSRQMAKARERARREREERVVLAMKEFEALKREKPDYEEAKRRVSLSDPEARVMKQPDGGFAPSYNVQITTDAANMLVVGVDVTQEGNDFGQLTPAVERVKETFGENPDQVVADAGYVSRDNIVAMAAEKVEFIGPRSEEDRKDAASYEQRGVSPEYRTEAFVYDQASDTFRCPQGKVLSHQGKHERVSQVYHRYRAKSSDCRGCPVKNHCCPENEKTGRSIQQSESFREVEEFREKMETEAARAIYRQRSQVAEFPNMWLKSKFGLRQFHVRGLRKVGMEALWACLTYNIRQWYRISWKSVRSAALAAA